MMAFLLFVFAWFTDTHINTTSDRYNALADGLADAHSQQAQFAIVTGDLTDFGTNAEILNYRDAISTALFPVYSLSGNHDQKWSQTGGLYIRQVLGDDRFCFDYGGIKYIGMPSGPVLRIGGDRVSTETLIWLKTQLEQTSPGQKIIVFTHHPFSIGTISNGYEVTNILKNYNVQVILAGHVHSYTNTTYDGIPTITTQQSYSRKYTLVEITSTSIELYTRSIGGTKTLLTTVPLGTYDHSLNENSLTRPSYGINSTYGFVKRRWTYTTESSIYSSPTIAGNRLIACDAGGKIRCFNWSTGALIWTYDTKTTLYASAVIKDGKVYIGGMDQNVYCLQLSDGTSLWKRKLDGGIMAPAHASTNAVYVATCVNSKVHALDPSNGNPLWSSSTFSGHVEAAPSVFGKRIYVGSWDGYVRAFSISTGETLWTSKVGSNRFFSAASQSPILHKGSIILTVPTNSGGNPLALDTLTGNLVWKSTENMTQAIGISEDCQTYFFKGFYHIRAIKTESLNLNLTKNWEVRHNDNYDESGSGMIEKEGNVFFCTSRGYVGAINTATGGIQWQHRVSASLVNTPAPIDSKRVAVTTTDGRIFVLEQTMLFNPLRLSSYSPPKAEQHQSFSYQFTSSGAEGQSIFFIREGQQILPQGVVLDSISGMLHGTPTQAGLYRFTVTTLDQGGNYDAQYVEWEVTPNSTGSIDIPVSDMFWKVFPNPIQTGKPLFIESIPPYPGLQLDEPMDVYFRTSSGTLVKHIKTHPGSPIDVHQLLPGFYFLTGVVKGKTIFNKRILNW